MKKNDKLNQFKNTSAIKITNESNQTNINYSSSIKSDFSRIKDQILTEIKNELFSENGELIISNYKNILTILQDDLLSKYEKGKGIKLNQDILSKKFEFLLLYINERERANDELKMKTIETLSDYLTQLSDIILNYFLITNTDENEENEENDQQRGVHLDQRFVSLINLLSKLIKSYTSKAQLISKLSNDLLKMMNDKLLVCKTLSSDIYIQSSVINKSNIKTIQTKSVYLNETIESLLSYHNEITNKSFSTEINHSSFYQEAKDIFRKLKTLQNELKTNNENPIVKEDNESKLTRLKTLMVKPKRVSLSTKQKKIMSRSTDHFSNTQKIYLNNINNSFNDACILNTSPVETEPQEMIINLNNTAGCERRGERFGLKEIVNINDLLERNKFLQTEVDNLNNTMNKSNFERKRLKRELDEIKKSTSKGKRKLNFSSSVETAAKQTESTYNNINKINLNKNDYLAKRIIDFMQNMKDLQDAICKKEKDVAQKKKDFEKKKKELLYLASDYREKNSVSSIEKEDLFDEKDTEQSIKNKELKQENEKLLAELESKNTEILKMQEANTKKQNENKKNSIPMAKLKEFENIIKTLKNQIESSKEEKKLHEAMIEEVKKENQNLKNENEKNMKALSEFSSKIKTTEKSEKESNDQNNLVDKCSFLNLTLVSFANKFSNIYKLLATDKQSAEPLVISKEISKQDIAKNENIYLEIVKIITSQTGDLKVKLQHESTPSTITPCKTPQISLATQPLLEENKRLKALFEDCMTMIYSSIKEYAPEMFEEDDDMSFNYGSGLNIPVNLLDSSNNSNRNQSANATIDKESVKSAVEMFKKYNTHINEELNKLKEDKMKIEKENEVLKLRCETYKKALDDALKNNPNPNEKEFLINFNNTTKTFSLQDMAETTSEKKISKVDSPKSINESLIKQNKELQIQIKALNEELKIKSEALTQALMKESNIDKKARTKSCTCSNQDNDFKALYLKSEKRIKELEEQYENLVKEVINGEAEEDNKEGQGKDDEDNANDKNIDFMQMINSHHFNDENPHLNKNFETKMLGLIDNPHNSNEQEELLLTQLNAIKAELKEQREQNKKLKEEIELLHKSANDFKISKGSEKNDYAAPIRSALETLIVEINMTAKIKEILCVIFKFVGLNDEEINKIFLEKDKKKPHKRLFS